FCHATFRRPPPATRFPYTTLFRSEGDGVSVVGFPYVAHAAVELIDGATSEADLTLTAGPAAKTVTVRLAPAPGTAIYQSWVAYQDRKSTRLNSSHVKISYAVFCLK